MARRPAPKRHGTNAGYHQHVRAETMPCTPCLVAHADHSKIMREHRRCAPGLGWPLVPERGET